MHRNIGLRLLEQHQDQPASSVSGKADRTEQLAENDVAQGLSVVQAVCVSNLNQLAAKDSRQSFVGG